MSAVDSLMVCLLLLRTYTLISGLQDSQDGQTYFLKLHAPWNTLISGAQLLNLRKRIKLRRVSQSRVTIALLKTPFLYNLCAMHCVAEHRGASYDCKFFSFNKCRSCILRYYNIELKYNIVIITLCVIIIIIVLLLSHALLIEK